MTSLADLWSLTHFNASGLSDYAKTHLFIDTRKGIITLCWVLFLILSCASVLYHFLGYSRLYVYSSAILAILSLHMAISVRVVTETRVLYLMATTLLVINGVAMVLLAHQTGGFNSALFASVVLLFLVMPLVPWGLREAVLIVTLVYGVFTLSTLSVDGRFDNETLWVLQFVMLGASLTTLVVISRNAVMRRNDIESRYELEQAHNSMQLLSLKDPLTGAWNRRFLEQKFNEIICEFCKTKQPVFFVTIDINNFKPLNDNYGHDYGDLVLKQLVKQFTRSFQHNECLIRLGGDEFAILMSCSKPQTTLKRVAEKLSLDPLLFRDSSIAPVTLSIGIVQIDCERTISLDQIYREADRILYRAKSKKLDDSTEATIEICSVR